MADDSAPPEIVYCKCAPELIELGKRVAALEAIFSPDAPGRELLESLRLIQAANSALRIELSQVKTFGR